MEYVRKRTRINTSTIHLAFYYAGRTYITLWTMSMGTPYGIYGPLRAINNVWRGQEVEMFRTVVHHFWFGTFSFTAGYYIVVK